MIILILEMGKIDRLTLQWILNSILQKSNSITLNDISSAIVQSFFAGELDPKELVVIFQGSSHKEITEIIGKLFPTIEQSIYLVGI